MKITIQIDGLKDQVIDIPTPPQLVDGGQGAPWIEREENLLRIRWAKAVKQAFVEVAGFHGRTPGAIRCRLEKMGFLPKGVYR